VTCVASGLVDHVDEDPPEVDRADPERGNRGHLVERPTAAERRAAPAARRRVELNDAGDGVAWGEPHRLIRVVGAWCIPWWGHRHAEQPALEPAILGPCQMLDDARDRQIRRWQQAGRGLRPLEVHESGRGDRPVVIEALNERGALVARLEIRVRHINACHGDHRGRLPGAAGEIAKNRPRSPVVSSFGVSRWRSSACGTLAGVSELAFRPEPVRVLLFDLGGVVIDIDFQRCFAHWAHGAGCDAEELASRFSIDAAYEAHERGALPIGDYLEHLRRMLGLALTDDDFLAGWNDIWTGVSAEVAPLLAAASDACPLYAFTNSNPTHQAVWSQRFAEPLGLFASTFVSSEIGHRKPERAAFDHVASVIGAPPESILFFDDGLENVAGAREAGMQAVHVVSTESVRDALARLGATGHGTW
jgi:HAD superfamily hydrolase (TIGR01509 family)